MADTGGVEKEIAQINAAKDITVAILDKYQMNMGPGGLPFSKIVAAAAEVYKTVWKAIVDPEN
ncbi:MAG: hypothetical protein NTU41_12100 [Chloroflexi bacterium]|nr:hypothetical protein [Chloroflexota bacterium]